MKECIKEKIGILGGTFNPIHVGHLMLAQSAMDICQLQKVLIMPTGCSYLKDPAAIVAKEHRIEMTRLAIEDNECFELSTVETDRSGNSYTFETLDILCSEHPNYTYYYIIGADTLLAIETWKNPQEIFDRCTLVCAARDSTNEELENKSKQLKRDYGADIILMDIPEIKISSTMIRNMISKGMSCRYYLDEKVIRYIKDNGLYGIDIH